jgi:pimeloyl-ACP methyl ester carboxylesterase
MNAIRALFYCALFAVAAPLASARENAANARTLYVEVGGTRIAYRSIGVGSPILLLNRFRGTLDTWDPLFLDGLASGNAVITVDYPGVGYSSGVLPGDLHSIARFVADFAVALKLDTVAILGWSWGGLAAQAFILEHPNQVNHAILIGTNPPGSVENQPHKVFLDLAVKPVNDLADEEVLFFEPRSTTSIIAAKGSHARIYARPGVESKIPSTMDVFQTYFKVASAFREDKDGFRKKLTTAEIPILIVCGDNDISVPAPNWFPLVGKIRSAELVVYPQSGHAPQHQYPEMTTDLIKSFLARTRK